MKLTITSLALAFSVANSAADFSPIVEKGTYGTLLKVVNYTGNAQLIADNAPVTIFGPKDTAFDLISSLTDGYTAEQLSDVLLDHVVAGRRISSAMIVEKGCIEATTVGGLQLGIAFDPDGSTVKVNNIPVTEFNTDGDYGTMHGIEGVFVEGILGAFVPCPKPPILDPMIGKGVYNSLIDAIIETGSVSTLESNAPLTLFGPKDSAFDAIANTVAELDTDQLRNVLLNHMLVGEAFSVNELIGKGCIETTTVGGLQVGILFEPDGSRLSINGITVSDFDISGEYGVMHGIDSVLVEGVQGDFVPCPPFEANFGPIETRGIYSSLVSAIKSTGNDKVISANAPVTIFGPNDIAFATASGVIQGLSTEEVGKILLDHVLVGGPILKSNNIVERGCIDAVTTGGLDIAIRYNQTVDVVDVNGILVDDFNIEGDYGIMHGMQGILLDSSGYVPCPTPTFVEQIAETGNYSTLVNYLTNNTLVKEEFSSKGSLTVFGPNDPALADVASDLAVASETELVTTLGGHAIQSVFDSEVLEELGCVILRTIVGNTIRVMYVEGEESDGGYIMVDDAKVVLPDIRDDTSIFHGIDKVIDASSDRFECPETAAPVPAPTVPIITQPPTPPVLQSSGSLRGFPLALAASVVLAAVAF